MSNRNLKRAVTALETYFGTDKNDPCRGHFRNAVAFVANNLPELAQQIVQDKILTKFQIEAAQKGNKTGASEEEKFRMGRLVCSKAREQGIEIPQRLASRLDFAVA